MRKMVGHTHPHKLAFTMYGNTAAERGHSIGDFVTELSSAEAPQCHPPRTSSLMQMVTWNLLGMQRADTSSAWSCTRGPWPPSVLRDSAHCHSAGFMLSSGVWWYLRFFLPFLSFLFSKRKALFPHKAHLALPRLTLVSGCQSGPGMWQPLSQRQTVTSFSWYILPFPYLDSVPPERKVAIQVLPLSSVCDRNLSLSLTLITGKQILLSLHPRLLGKSGE